MGSVGMLSQTAQASQRFLFDELDPAFMSLVIIVCFFISGLIDSVAFNSWSCFVNMQTGNTIFAALGLGGQPQASHNQQYYKSLTSIGAFCLGALFFSAVHRYPTGLSQQPSSRRRLNFVISFFLQTAFIVIAATMVSLDHVSNKPFVSGSFSSGSNTKPPSMTNFLDLCPIALISFQAAGQVTLSRLLSIIELPTIVLSTLYHDFSADLYSLTDSWRKSTSMWDFVVVHQRRQLRRFACIAALLLGGIIGGEMYKSSIGMGGALWVSAGLKLAIVIGWFFWRKKPEDEVQSGLLPR